MKMDKEYIATPKPEPTPIFDEWKRCPGCAGMKTELRIDYNERSAPTNNDDIHAVMHESQRITVHFFCNTCGHESEHRETTLDGVR